MTIEERFDRLTTVTSAHADRIEGLIRASECHREKISALIRAAESRQDQIDARDAQIGALIPTFQQQAAEGAAFDRRLESTRILVEENVNAPANLECQWQAYINTLPRQ
jgi:hypothetical protein